MIVAVPPVRALDVMGPAEVFGDANRLRGGDPSYSVEIVSAGDEKLIATHIKTALLGDQTYRGCREHFDTVLVAGGDGAQYSRFQPAFLDWLREPCAGCAALRFGLYGFARSGECRVTGYVIYGVVHCSYALNFHFS